MHFKGSDDHNLSNIPNQLRWNFYAVDTITITYLPCNRLIAFKLDQVR